MFLACRQAPPLAAKVHGSDTSTMMQWCTSLEDWSCVYFLQEMSKEFEACMRPLPPRLTSRALGTKHWKHWTSCLRSLWFGLWDQASQRPARWFLQTSWIHWIQCSRSGFHCLWHVGAILDNSCFCEASRPAFDQCVREVERPSWSLKSSQHIYLQRLYAVRRSWQEKLVAANVQQSWGTTSLHLNPSMTMPLTLRRQTLHPGMKSCQTPSSQQSLGSTAYKSRRTWKMV